MLNLQRAGFSSVVLILGGGCDTVSTTVAEQIVASNRRAFHDYTILETVEAGMALKGAEVKSLRAAQVTLQDSFARIEGNELFLHHMQISPYPAGHEPIDPLRKRKLLLHRRQIRSLIGKVTQKHLTIVPLKVYFKQNIAKVELAVVRGKQEYDKRAAIRKRESAREIARATRIARGR